MIKSIKRIIGRKKERELKRHILYIDKVYPDWHSKAGQFTHNGSKVTGRSEVLKIHEITSDYKYWKQAEEEINSGNAKLTLSYKEIRGSEVFETRIRSFSNIKVQVARFSSSVEDGLIVGDKVIPVSEVAKNQGMSEKDFIEWYKFSKDEQVGIIHFTNFEY